MSQPMPPTQELVLEVLAARWRLGEKIWPLSTRCRPAVNALADKHLVDWKSGIVENTIQVWLTPIGRDQVLDNDYIPPILADKKAIEIRNLRRRLAELEATP